MNEDNREREEERKFFLENPRISNYLNPLQSWEQINSKFILTKRFSSSRVHTGNESFQNMRPFPLEISNFHQKITM